MILHCLYIYNNLKLASIGYAVHCIWAAVLAGVCVCVCVY